MAKQNNPFLTAHYEKIALTEQTSKRIQLIYKQSAQDIERKLRNLPMRVPSDALKKLYLENLLKDINKSSASFNRLIESTIRNSGEQSGLLAIEAGNKAVKSLGLDIKGAYSYIPRQEVLNIASGKLYGDKWTLSQSIWKNGIRTKSDIQNVVAKGLTENKPIKDIADDLMKYVDPTARKPWDWSKVYPGTAQQVDYNAQRLARTMIQHAFQTSMVQSQQYNPFCQGIIWHSVGIHGRTCEECVERDGNVYPVKDLPLDHPNGLCYFEPALDSMNTVADRLADWVNGKDDPELDSYVANAFNLSPKSTTGKRAVNTVKESAAKKVVKPKHTIVNGKDVSESFVRRKDKFKFEIEDIIDAQGFSGKPRVVPAKEFDDFVKESKFIAQRTYSAESKEILDEYRRMLYDGKWYVDCGAGGAQYGQGMYCAADYTGKLSKGILEEMEHYQELGIERGAAKHYTETLTLDKTAKIVKYTDIKEEYDIYLEKAYKNALNSVLEGSSDILQAILELEYKQKQAGFYGKASYADSIKSYKKMLKQFHPQEHRKLNAYKKQVDKKFEESSIQNIGSYAAARGYDAINAVGHGESGSYTVILNRTKLIIKEQE